MNSLAVFSIMNSMVLIFQACFFQIKVGFFSLCAWINNGKADLVKEEVVKKVVLGFWFPFFSKFLSVLGLFAR